MMDAHFFPHGQMGWPRSRKTDSTAYKFKSQETPKKRP
ncbi:conserved hypothetical protein [delta proteobacterium NaphS2]|nr:conserved hypothetical protein [delta proteobacterium NaphS2]